MKYNEFADELLDDSKAYHKLLPRYKVLEELCQTAESQLSKAKENITAAVRHITDIAKLLNQLYEYAMKYEYCNKDYSQYVDILKYKNRNPNRTDRSPFSSEEIEALWVQKNNRYAQIVLMLIYSGVRVSELLDLKRENKHIDEHYFNVVESKTENGIRIVPIADKTYPFFRKWYDDDCEYLLHTPEGAHFDYRNYYDSYWTPVMELIGCSHKPHDTRHTCISMLTEKEVSPTMIKKIVGHSGAMSLTERVYTHVNVQELLRAINRI